MDNLKRNRGKLTCATAKGNTESRSGEEGKKIYKVVLVNHPKHQGY